MNKEKFYELVKTINDNIDMLNYIVMPDGKLTLIAECNDEGHHLVRVWNTIQSHENIIAKRFGDNQMTREINIEAPTEEQIKKLVHGDDK